MGTGPFWITQRWPGNAFGWCAEGLHVGSSNPHGRGSTVAAVASPRHGGTARLLKLVVSTLCLGGLAGSRRCSQRHGATANCCIVGGVVVASSNRGRSSAATCSATSCSANSFTSEWEPVTFTAIQRREKLMPLRSPVANKAASIFDTNSVTIRGYHRSNIRCQRLRLLSTRTSSQIRNPSGQRLRDGHSDPPQPPRQGTFPSYDLHLFFD